MRHKHGQHKRVIQCTCVLLSACVLNNAAPPSEHYLFLLMFISHPQYTCTCTQYFSANSHNKGIFLQQSLPYKLQYTHTCICTRYMLCLVCLTLLASFFLPSYLSLKHVHAFLSFCFLKTSVLYTCIPMYTYRYAIFRFLDCSVH